jgi:hypothetical protein
MSYSHSQPDELAIITQQMDAYEINESDAPPHKNHLNETHLENWHTGYISPYRAAYFRNAN